MNILNTVLIIAAILILLLIVVTGMAFFMTTTIVVLAIPTFIFIMLGLTICSLILSFFLTQLSPIIGLVISFFINLFKPQTEDVRPIHESCDTKYPILLVHGVFFRDYKYRNYWGRIPNELRKHGATIYYGNHSSAKSVEDSSKELQARIKEIVEKTGCKKVNVIAHSKGGLDIKEALKDESIASMIASVTTINTPHRGCIFADSLLQKTPSTVQEQLSKAYNTAMSKLGDDNPDFKSAIIDLTSRNCIARDEIAELPSGVYCQSVGSKINKPVIGQFPLNISSQLISEYDGPNDGLVGEDSFQWGSTYIFLESDNPLGISHGDMIDLTRKKPGDFDVLAFYVDLVSDLKSKGY